MRPSNKRSRSKQNRPRTLGNIVNRVFDSSGPEGKVRGTPQQIIDKYQLLARDAQLSGDRVAAENFLQHSEHYTRMLNEAQLEMAREADQRRDQPGSQQGGGQQGGQSNNGYGQNRRNDGRDESDDQSDSGDGRQDNRQDNRQDTRQDNRPEPRHDNRQDARPEPRGEQRSEPRAEPRPDQPREPRPEWKERRNNRRPDERRNRRDAGDPRDGAQAEVAGSEQPSESMLVETPESRAPAETAVQPQRIDAAPVQPSQGQPDPAQPVVEGDAAPKPRNRRAPRKPREDAAPAAPVVTNDAE